MDIEKNNSFKAYVLGALIITSAFIIIGISLSYAFFINRVEEENSINKGVNIGSGELIVNFSTSRNINATVAGLINDSDVTNSTDNYTEFTVTLPTDAKVNIAHFTLSLTNIQMTSNLVSEDFKWTLYEYSSGNLAPVTNGDFSGVTGIPATPVAGTQYSVSDISLISTPIDISKGDPKTYRLYIWLSNDPIKNQTSLSSGSFSGKVGFRATT